MTAWGAGSPSEYLAPTQRAFARLPIPAMPAYEPALRRDGQVETVTRTEIVAELCRLTGKQLNERGTDFLPADEPRITCRYETYSVVHAGWMKSFVKWFEKELKVLGLTYQDESWDCDDYSVALNAFVDLALLRNKSHPPPQLVGRLVVYQDRRWAGVRAGGVHELVIVRTERGWLVVEPQSGEFGKLDDYPNRESVKEILFN